MLTCRLPNKFLNLVGTFANQTAAGIEVDIRREGIAGVIREMFTPREMEAAE